MERRFKWKFKFHQPYFNFHSVISGMDSSFETTVILTDPQYQMYRIEYEYNMQYHILLFFV